MALSRVLPLISLLISFALPMAVRAEGTNVAFGGLKADITLPVEVQADSFSVKQSDGTAVFSGNVAVSQGEMRMTAAEITVEYSTDGKAISRLIASGGVLLVNALDAAEAQSAVYTIATGEVVLTGSVVLTQGRAAMSGEKLIIDLTSGNGRMEGRVTTTFTPSGN